MLRPRSLGVTIDGRRVEAVDARADRLRAAVDGEPERLATPLAFKLEPQALRVLLPPG